MRWFPRLSRVPLQRRWITDLLYFGQKLYIVAGSGLANASVAAAARKLKQPAVSWDAIWVKAVALAAVTRPELRTAYLRFPWSHLYTHPFPVACVAVERIWNGAPGIFYDMVKDPAAMSLVEIDALYDALAALPIEAIGGFRFLIRVTRLPWILRSVMWHVAVQWSGRMRSRYLGTYALMKSPRRIQVQFVTPALSFSFYWTPPDPNGDFLVRMFFDHRLADASTAVRIVASIENAMNGPIAAELTALAQAASKSLPSASPTPGG